MTELQNLESIGLPADFKVTTGTNGHSRRIRFLVTGGCGYFGFELSKVLYQLGGCVTLLDIQIPPKIEAHLDDRFMFIKGDIRDYKSVLKACQNVDCVYHVASFGMSGRDQLDKELTVQVNVNGTKNVIRACIESSTPRLIYTSSYNVVLEDKPIRNGDESVPHADPRNMVDNYSKTKLAADKLVLKANGSSLSDGGKLLTCCLRPAGIYGPGERRHIARISCYIESGIVLMRIGDAVVDWVHVNNLVQIHLLALPGLTSKTHCAAGKAYFVSDSKPIRCIDFLRPLFIGLGSQVPRIKLPRRIAYAVAFFIETIFYLLKPIITIDPFLTRNEVIKMEVDHFHSMEKARRELGYKPLPYEFSDTVDLYLQERAENKKKFPQSHASITTWKFMAFFVVVFTFLFCIIV